ncbi:hypothetical protein BV898_18663 [Hypsibius exemplaris]|uniref:Uncharacterized protein n=1 Tax=Hypsibius exemplaris TaxID=2072580 RepID=A0A9X6NHN8_HYPEX|nr:hypothetical protein BV898_18663 [Hypsibius exemplaris]
MKHQKRSSRRHHSHCIRSSGVDLIALGSYNRSVGGLLPRRATFRQPDCRRSPHSGITHPASRRRTAFCFTGGPARQQHLLLDLRTTSRFYQLRRNASPTSGLLRPRPDRDAFCSGQIDGSLFGVGILSAFAGDGKLSID